MDHYQWRRGVPTFSPSRPHTHAHTHPLSSPAIASFSDGFRCDNTVLVSSLAPIYRARKYSKINGGRLDGSGDSEDHN